MQQQNQKRPTELDFKRTILSDPKYPLSSNYQGNMSCKYIPVYNAADQGCISQPRPTQQREYFADQQHPYMAGGDAHVQALKAKYSSENKEGHSKRSHIRNDRNKAGGETYDEWSTSSARSGSTRLTAIEQSKKGRQLLKLTHSKASLMKTVDEGMKGTAHDQCCCNKLHSSQQSLPKGIDDSNPCPSPSAGVINEQIIHPMIKKFRLLYLHNIKEEVSIMEDLEMLPHKLDEVCKKMEKD